MTLLSAFASGTAFSPTRNSRSRSICRHPRMAAGAFLDDALKPDDVTVVGVATCFRREGKQLQEVLILEPLPASAVDCVVRLQVPTSYLRVYGIKMGDLSDSVSDLPDTVILPDENVALAEDFAERVQAASRTYRRSPEIAAMVPPGTIQDDLNHSIAQKRILNENWEPSFDDNVKQDQSIDVYNRASDEVDNTTVMASYNA